MPFPRLGMVIIFAVVVSIRSRVFNVDICFEEAFDNSGIIQGDCGKDIL
ncbi:hypothetical protein Ptr902_03513 [Pyrenophora tritici-repentis]|uniref:Uncharacterized protein n=1 Tax=Pyrenophora tritici-repentis TaxID=45151 RepID=A0A5M9L746_9PLEO|nr:hypothetical protein PtrV1_08569 [Pyrenophora tritici-repentis]KAF7570272.1 hypothetical protein PtrM4_102740 [Pyrenophora tritici-repentis]KAI0571901.1 hypothetical protein Alg215_10114 [Pyrenophora tritici-repentis]KAI0573842.1 hypothetical protein Alg130_09932 [Pyrenophora tritici-repentis]KAI0605910.1 hypothetical protein TUN205_09837 [Pyrenophora tritici-repentis]